MSQNIKALVAHSPGSARLGRNVAGVVWCGVACTACVMWCGVHGRGGRVSYRLQTLIRILVLLKVRRMLPPW